MKFRQIYAFLSLINIRRLDDRIETALLENKAVIYRTCQKRYSKQRLARAKQQSTLHEEISQDEMPSPKETHTSVDSTTTPYTLWQHHSRALNTDVDGTFIC